MSALPGHLLQCQTKREMSHRVGLMPTVSQSSIPLLVTATSEGWALRGQKFTSLWGLLQLLTQGKRIQLTIQFDFPLQ